MQKDRFPFLTTITRTLFGNNKQAAAQEQLFQLCAYGQPSKHPGDKELDIRIREQLERGADINAQNKDGDTPLIILARRALTREALSLIGRKADITLVNNKGENAFLAAAAAGDGRLVEILLTSGADLRATDAAGHNAAYLMVHATADFKDTSGKESQMIGLRTLLGRGLGLDESQHQAIYSHKPHLLPAVPDLYKVHHLSEAAQRGDAQDVRLTLGLPVHPDAPAQYRDNTPLCWSATGGNLDMMEVLLERGADIELKSPKTHRTPLQSAVRAGQVDAFGYLLDNGAKIDGKMELLELARDNGTKEIMRAVYDAMIERGIMKTEVDAAKTKMKTIKLKTPGGT